MGRRERHVRGEEPALTADEALALICRATSRRCSGSCSVAAGFVHSISSKWATVSRVTGLRPAGGLNRRTHVVNTLAEMPVETAPIPAMPEVNAATPLAANQTPARFSSPARGATRWPLFLLTAIYALNVADQFVVPTLFPLLKQEFGLSGARSASCRRATSSWSCWAPCRSATSPIGCTYVIGWGTAVWGLAMIWTGAAWSYASLLARRARRSRPVRQPHVAVADRRLLPRRCSARR